MNQHTNEINLGKRFEFGRNWQEFIKTISEDKILIAQNSLKSALNLESLVGMRFLDAGSGSGLFSLAARRLGASVFSFDYDPQSVACTRELKARFYNNDPDWIISEGSVLDKVYLNSIGQFDFVYSWGVLHHTGEMWQAIENVANLVKHDGTIFIAIYNDAGRRSTLWRRIKSVYCRYPVTRPFIVVGAFLANRSGWIIQGLFSGNLKARWNIYAKTSRGMTPSHDLIDWVGGFPYEYARPEDIFFFLRQRGFNLRYLNTVGGDLGCNEFVFIRDEFS